MDSHLLGVITVNQCTLKTGKEHFGERANEAVVSELSEMDSSETYEPQGIKICPTRKTTITLKSHILISNKRADKDGHQKIKGSCVSKQSTYDGYEKMDESSSTVITDSIFLTGVTGTNKNRAMSTIPLVFIKRICIYTSLDSFL